MFAATGVDGGVGKLNTKKGNSLHTHPKNAHEMSRLEQSEKKVD